MTYPEWKPPDPWIEFSKCTHFPESYVDCPRAYPDGETPAFTYHGRLYQGFPSGGGNDYIEYMYADADFNFAPVFGQVRNFVDHHAPVEAYIPDSKKTWWWWESLPINYPPWDPNEIPYVHWELETRIHVLFSIEGFIFYHWIPFDIPNEFSGEIYLYTSYNPPGYTPTTVCLLHYPRPNIQFYRRVVIASDIVSKAIPPLLFFMMCATCANSLPQSPAGRRRRARTAPGKL